MKVIEIKRGRYWTFNIFGISIIRKLCFIRMVCESVSGESESRSDVAIIPMDKNLINKCDKLKYRVNKFYNSNPSSFLAFVLCAAMMRFVAMYAGKKQDILCRV